MEKIPITSPLSTEEPARSLSEAIAVIDAGGIVRFATPTIAAYYGYPLEAIIGGRAIEFIAPESRAYVRERWNALLAHPERMSDTFSLSIQTAAGQRIPIRASVWRLPGRDEFLLLHHVIERVRDRLDTLYAIQAAVSSMLDVEKLMETVLHEVRRLIPCSSCAIFFLERDKTVQVRRWHNEAIKRDRSLIREGPPELETSRFLRETGQPLIINDTLADPRWRELPSRRPIRSWLGAPLVHHGQFLGELNLDSPDPNQFSQEDAELAHALATQIAAALYNARQYQDEQRHAERLRVLNEISLAISQLDLTSVLEMIYQNVARLMDVSTFFIGLLDAEAQVVHLVGSYDFGQHRPDEFQGADEGITGLVLRTRRPLILHDTEHEPLPPEIIVQGEMPRSVLMMPLLVQDEIVGVISVQSYEPNSYTQDDIDLLETIAGTIAVAVRNAQLYDQTAERLHALETLHKMSLELAAVQDPQAVSRLVTDAAAELFTSDDTYLVLSPGQPWEVAAWHCP
ncbi:MAG: GAF domain-containing protein, partial [Chloroflexota bacterium]